MKKLLYLINIIFILSMVACHTVPKEQAQGNNSEKTNLTTDSTEARAIIHQAPNQAEIDSIKAEKLKKKKK